MDNEKQPEEQPEEQTGRYPGCACLISSVASLVIIGIMKILKPGSIIWLMVVLPIFTIVIFIITLIERKQVVLAVIGLLMQAGAIVWFFH